jgi:hypothetical protein
MLFSLSQRVHICGRLLEAFSERGITIANNLNMNLSRRCPDIKIIELPGDHETLLDPENMSSLGHAFITATRDRADSCWK